MIADLLQKKTKPIFIVGNKGIESGIALTITETKSHIKLLHGINIDAYVGTRKEYNDMKKNISTIGIGASKYIVYDKYSVGVGVYATQPVIDFFNIKNLNIGAGLTIKF